MTTGAQSKPFPWREAAPGIALWLAAVAAFPQLPFAGIRAATRHGVGGVLTYLTLRTAIRFAIYGVVLPYGRRISEEHDRLRQQLGREPTPEEHARHFGYGD